MGQVFIVFKMVAYMKGKWKMAAETERESIMVTGLNFKENQKMVKEVGRRLLIFPMEHGIKESAKTIK